MKLLVQSDDFGLTKSVALGIKHGIEHGIIRNTGLFINMETTDEAIDLLKNMSKGCFGQDINLVTGKPVTDPRLIPSLVDKKGVFIRSVDHIKNNKLLGIDKRVYIFEEDPFPYGETYLEIENQIKLFIEKVGKKPDYLHGHSLSTPNTRKCMKELADKYGLTLSYEFFEKHGFQRVKSEWTPKTFSFEEQLNTNVETSILRTLEENKNVEKLVYICHAGYLEKDLFDLSTYHGIRMSDLRAVTSPKIAKYIEENSIELVTYNDFK